jgi:hypothetical protein
MGNSQGVNCEVRGRRDVLNEIGGGNADELAVL